MVMGYELSHILSLLVFGTGPIALTVVLWHQAAT